MSEIKPGRVKDHIDLFVQKDYEEMFESKRQYESCATKEEVQKVLDWTKTEEYQEKNFERKHLVINPLKSCQPLGGLFAAIGFEDTMPYVHGSQGCAAYFRSHFTRHFKEPFPTVSDSMTEDAAVFGGHNNMNVGLENVYKLYKPSMIAICTSCMSEVIGDDLNNFIKGARKKEAIPEDLPVTYAHTPSFVGSHVVGYDNMMQGILSQMGEKKDTKTDRINVIMGFDTYIGNYREIKRIFELFGAECLLLSDPTENLDSPTDGNYQMLRGGTPLEDLKDAPNSKATLILQKHSATKTADYIEKNWEHPVKVVNPLGLKGSDELMMAISELTGKEIPYEIENERGRLVDAMGDSYNWVHDRTFGINGDPDMAYGLSRFVMEMGGEPKHVLVTNANKAYKKYIEKMLGEYPQGQETNVWPGKDMWHFRSLLFTDPVDYIIGNSFAKYLHRDTETPLIRIGFPLFDRHHLHRYSTIGYLGGLNLLNWIVNTILDEIDRKTMHTTSFDLIR
ncbi:nitrogenase molybdenum-iron protein subunit beta [Limisalsivibrio acetivorans]|uniref:nitrogenase molybdenum-iron protein subunit beta n=1 Tax=Limisalsivibrio acetivorans TaxID=1304888 RepID=UPI0003B5C521|nr:nitrogenase molybdenum-iron protein subunit beta [Limisalsivibrio acetivorans]